MTVDTTAFVFCRVRRGYGKKDYNEKKGRPYDDFYFHIPSSFQRLIYLYKLESDHASITITIRQRVILTFLC